MELRISKLPSHLRCTDEASYILKHEAGEDVSDATVHLDLTSVWVDGSWSRLVSVGTIGAQGSGSERIGT